MSALISLLFFALLAHAEPSPNTDAFQAGIRALQEAQPQAAFDHFSAEYAAGKKFAALFYNWGLAAHQLDKKGLSAALWRRALSEDPELASARQALDFVGDELPKISSADDLAGWPAFRARILDRVSLNKFLAATWILLVVSLYLLIRYWGARTRALRTETPLPHAPTIGIVFAGLTILFLFMTTAKAVTLTESRATVISPNVSLKTGPSPEDNNIFELVEGLDVAIRQVQPNWALVSLNTGASGWVPTAALFQHTNDARLW